MDVSLNAEQRAWQRKARELAQGEIRPLALKQEPIAAWALDNPGRPWEALAAFEPISP